MILEDEKELEKQNRAQIDEQCEQIEEIQRMLVTFVSRCGCNEQIQREE